MMDMQTLNQTVQNAIGRQVTVEQEGRERYIVTTPFLREDGDHFNIVLRGDETHPAWLLSDEGETLLHLSYWMDYSTLKKGARREVIERVLGQFGVENREGELRMEIDYADLSKAIFTFVQALTRINDVTYLSRETVRATFMDDFREFMIATVPPERLTFDYHHPRFDRRGVYTVDALINHRDLPLYVFAIGNNDRCRDVTINLHMYQQWGIKYQSIAIFEDKQAISRDVLARFSDVADKQFSSLLSSEPQIAMYLKERLAEAG